MSLESKERLIKALSAIIAETAHDARVGHGYGSVGGYSSTDQTLGGNRTAGHNIYPYLEKPTIADADDCDNEELDDVILTISSKIDSFRPNFDPNNQRTDKRTLGGNPLGEARWGGQMDTQLPSNSLGMVTPASRALNSPKGNKGTAMGGQNTQINARRPTGSIRDFSAGTKDMNQDMLDEPVYDFRDILGHNDDERGSIDKMKKLTWILQNDDDI